MLTRVEGQIYKYVPYEQHTEIVLYGERGFPLCDALTDKLTKEGIPDILKNVMSDSSLREEMWRVMSAAGHATNA